MSTLEFTYPSFSIQSACQEGLMAFIQTTWRDGSNFNHGLTKEEYFYDQIFKAVEHNVAEHTLPFFNDKADSVPIELTTGKIINDENLIALEQIAAKKGYGSNVWIYGDTLEKLQHEGITLNFKRDTEPVLCLTKYANATHLNDGELYIAEGGSKSKAQYLYNYDSLDDRSKKAVDKYFSEARTVGENYSIDNLRNFIDNVKKSRAGEVPQLNNLKETLKAVSEDVSKAYSRNTGSKIDLTPVMNAQAKHMCQTVTAAKIKSDLNEKNETACYSVLSKAITDAKNSGKPVWKVGENLTKALDAGTMYAKSYTSKDFNLEIRKEKEENNHKKANLKRNNDMGWGY